MSRKVSLLLLVLSFLIVPAAVVHADVRLPSLISDNMVLQQKAEVPIWGWAEDGEVVTVQIQNQKATATAQGGKWMVRLKPLKAGGPFTLTIAGKNRIEFKNVLVGEVWICGGQSNMQWQLRQTDGAEAEIARANYPQIRLITVPRLEVDKPVDDFKSEWKETTPESVATFSAVGYYFGRDLHKALNVPVGLINNAVGGSPAESWMQDYALSSDTEYRQFLGAYPGRMAQYEEAMKKYREDAERAKAENKPAPRAPGRPWMPAGLYNGMMAPLVPFAIKGAIWYQGESNAGRAYQYRRLFPDMIRNWRSVMGQGNFPFLFVQLAAFGPNSDKLGESDWAELREAQTMTLKASPHTGMALAIDHGTYDDIHPRNKQPIGARLALSALAIAYGRKIVHSGPMYESMKADGEKIRISFTSTGGGLESKGGELKGFLIAGEDRKWHPAQARIDGKHVVVWSSEVSKPVAVRYAWAKFPECNLYNKEGLPAISFRTDDWPGVTQPK